MSATLLTIGGLAGALAAIFGVGLVMVKLVKWVVKTARNTSHFLDDWKGEGARDGKPAQPGVMQRLAAMEHELKPNSGGSIKDAVTRIEDKLGDTGDKLQAITDAIADLGGRVTHLETEHTCKDAGRRRRRPSSN